jgi:hypothetical protein
MDGCERRRDSGPRRRWAAGLAGSSPANAKTPSRAPNSTGDRPKAKGGHKELTERLVEEGEASAEEIDCEGGAPARLPWCGGAPRERGARVSGAG